MKQFLFLFASLLLAHCNYQKIFAQVRISLPVTGAVIYPNCAVVSRAKILLLEAGEQTISIGNLETSFYVQTIKADFGGDINLIDIDYAVVRKERPDFSEKFSVLQAQADSLQDLSDSLDARLLGLEEALHVLNENRTVYTIDCDDATNEIIARSIQYANSFRNLDRERQALERRNRGNQVQLDRIKRNMVTLINEKEILRKHNAQH